MPIVRKIIEKNATEFNWNDTALKNETRWHKSVIDGKHLVESNQKHDILLEYRCPDRWLVRMSWNQTQYYDWEFDEKKRIVDPKTCASITTDLEYRDYLNKTG